MLSAMAIGFEIYFIVQAIRRSGWAKRIKDTPTSKIGDVRGGYREIKGRVVAPDRSRMLTAPLTGKRCVYYEFTVAETTGGSDGGSTTTIIHDKRNAGCQLDDGTGVANIALAGAELVLDTDRHEKSGFLRPASKKFDAVLAKYNKRSKGLVFNKDLEAKESILEEGDRLYVLGPAKVVKGRVSFKVGGGQPMIVSDKSERDLLAQCNTKAIGYTLGAVLLPVAAVIALMVFDPFSENKTDKRLGDDNTVRNDEIDINALLRVEPRNESEKLAIAEIKRLGGKVMRISDWLSVDLSNTQVTDADLVHLKGVTSIHSLELSNTQVSDAGLEHLKGLTDLIILDLRDTQVTDEGIEKLPVRLRVTAKIH